MKPDDPRWVPGLFKGKQVFVLCDASGAAMMEGGRVPMKYRLTDDRVYRASLANVTDPSGQPLTPSGQSGAPSDRRSSGVEFLEGGGRRTEPAKQPPRQRPPAARTARDRAGPSAGEVHVFTDGACSGNPGAAAIGVVVEDGAGSKEMSEYLSDEGTNNLAELTAILRGLEAARDLDRRIVLFTDSQYAIGVLLKGWKAKVHVPLIARIKKLMETFQHLEVRYVPGHSGIPGNERADELAREAIEERRRG